MFGSPSASTQTTEVAQFQMLETNHDISKSQQVCLNMTFYSLGIGVIAGAGAGILVSTFLMGHYDLNDCLNNDVCFLNSFKIMIPAGATFGAACGVTLTEFLGRTCGGSFKVRNSR